MNGKLNAIDLFSGYGGISLALSEYCRPIIYCEIERYAQGILLSNFDKGVLPFAPIWDDVTTLDGEQFKGVVDIVYGGFPCQDISTAGRGEGLAGKRSGLFYEVVRICKEASPLFIFLENVPAIRTRGAVEVAEALAAIGYDCRWHHLSAAEVGANHKRERWFLLAHSIGIGQSRQREFINSSNCEADSTWQTSNAFDECFPREWKTEPSVGRVVDGYPTRSHELKALGNGVVPLQVKTAWKKLMGLEAR